MMKIAVTADSTCDLSPELLSAYEVTLAPLSVLIDTKVYHDGVDVTPADIFRASDAGSKIHTAAVNEAEYEALFREKLADHDAVIHITIGSEFSTCYANACMAAEEVGHVWVVDSRNLSTGSGLLVLDAAELARSGMAPEDIAAELTRRAPLVDASFVVDKIDYLYRGGRCSGVAAVGAKLLNIKPSIEVTDGRMGVGRKYRGTFKRSLEHYVLDKLAEPDSIDNSRVFITHSPCDAEAVAHVRALLEQHAHFAEIHETMAGCTVSTHCGPGTLGILFKRTRPKEQA